ncbi:transglycosylase SLT domain-containing protein [Cereibacter sphaeroides]|uniref:transglycosylase SLT domain-containing protein n=1 Tax=Cereibacter sphaeroides TaxID=1063 RepID=UPI001F2CC55A|nr:transglycosylase SLT domain-containing protein [Cereibacter sphaeroides]MCE6961899.1 transglycosylase SLT domain-containing protein [Cereibacter sphaeroides]MCE6970674.1 transglycosylase SLT domain-containing protein [Cereibacter sphaeroides]MCE6975730.1 transglycosylase SLT domain-containing protein [Cereibacter sphaeroides]
MRLVLSLLLLLLGTPALRAAESCEQLAAAAGAEAGIPEGLMPAIARVESGRSGGAWPWTLNQGGKGMYFETRDEALAMLRSVVASGVTNIDVGCMQLNWRWHSPAFGSAEEMIDPLRNTRHAARFLVELRQRLGSWEAATAAYHSSDRSRGTAYLAKVEAARGGVQLADAGGPLPDEATMAAARVQGLLVLAPQPMVALGDGMAAFGLPEAAAAIPSRLPARLPQGATGLLAEADLPPRLRAQWTSIESFRAVLAEQP